MTFLVLTATAVLDAVGEGRTQETEINPTAVADPYKWMHTPARQR